MKVQSQISEKAYKATGFIGKYQKLISDTVIPYQYSVLQDKAPDTEKSHVVANFVNAAKVLKGEDVGDGFYGMVFQDSDAAKWIEAVAYYEATGKRTLLDVMEKNIEHIYDVFINKKNGGFPGHPEMVSSLSEFHAGVRTMSLWLTVKRLMQSL